MAKRRNQPPKPEEQAIGVSPISGTAPPVEHQFPPGVSGNPAGRKTAGATIREWMNALADQNLTEPEVRAIARDKRLPWTKRAAAARILLTMEDGDLADFQPFIRGEKTLTELRDAGVCTSLIKRARVSSKGDREIELHDRARTEAEFVMDRTEGKPKQEITQHIDGDLRTLAEGEAAADLVLAHLREQFGASGGGGDETAA